MIKTIKNFFKEIFKNDLGKYDPKADKLGWKWSLYLIIGLLLSYIIPCLLVYLEAWQFDWNVFKLMWGEETANLYKEGFYRWGYFICGVCANVAFVFMGLYTTYRVNGDKSKLSLKLVCKFLFVLSSVLGIICFIISLIVY